MSPELGESLQIETPEDVNRWRFTFQPYVTIPVSTYGSATVKGETVNYSLGLGTLLESLKATASGRVEAWNGNWGFIIDGYYANLGAVNGIGRVNTRTPSLFNTVDYLLSRGINTNLEQFANQLSQDIQALREAKELKSVEIEIKLDTLEENVQALKDTLRQDLQSLQDVAENINSLREELAGKKQNLETLTAKIDDLQGLRESGFELEPDQKIKAAIAINSAIANNQNKLQDLQAKFTKFNSLRNPPDLAPIRENLQQIKQTLQETQQKVEELRKIKDSEPLQQLQAAIQEKQAEVTQTLEKLKTVKEFVENRDPQQISNDITSNLDFSQGIYDFALTYNFGDTPPTSLPKEASGKPFPRLWFQPILGTRLNSLNLELENTINYKISSSLINIEGTAQNTYQASKLWFEPLLGAKAGIQLSDPITLWLRGDYSGFGLAGDTNYSWNLIFGMDWWVRENISLQLGYRFYEINYQNGSGSDAFGFSELFNGPFVSASFHF
ncbi:MULTISPECIES: hypothetical protein [unclassified Synechocystis]|uniref:hypothetical protein n=1 Tax=unclassified Synechocystis TaxID=2640012 RepID=UPI00042949DC|nr:MULTISPECIES: hypothetical protein [unclassified Synechocystis]AIE74917.1 hypothetical protein D082_23890 [Synechocystis sp. PCC 6714]MCT0253369.1 hypothetical protein [Synechocystis sp. CS-94]